VFGMKDVCGHDILVRTVFRRKVTYAIRKKKETQEAQATLNSKKEEMRNDTDVCGTVRQKTEKK